MSSEAAVALYHSQDDCEWRTVAIGTSQLHQ